MLSTSAMLNALPGDKASVRRYVTAAATTSLADGNVAMNITHSNLRQLVQELRFDLHTTIGDVKRRLYTFNGSNQGSMELHLKDGDGNLLARMLDENRALGYYGACSGMTIHVVDTDPFSLSRDGGLDDVSRIQKYKMSDEDYDRREKTYRNWKKEKAAADPAWKPPVFSTAGGAPPTGGPEFRAQEFVDPACVEGMSVGDRCSVTPGDRRGVVAYIGPVEGLSEGYWVGVRMDEPLGKNTGSYAGKAYFEAPEKCGSFVRPSYVTLGDFPPFFEVGGEGEGGGEGGKVEGSGEGGEAPPAAGEPVPAAKPAAATAKSHKPKRRGQLDDDDDDEDDDEL